MSRRGANGSKLVIIAVTSTLAAVGIGTIYLPFFVDRDKLRGMHEDADGNLSEKERKEYAMLLSQLQEQQMTGRRGNMQQDSEHNGNPSDSFPVRKENSMWARMKASSSEKK
jgi:hypothetical protein